MIIKNQLVQVIRMNKGRCLKNIKNWEVRPPNIVNRIVSCGLF